MGEKSIAVIPARGGSKRIPGKNIKLFMGKPIIEYSIIAALTSNLFERVIVSTDSKKISQVARGLGAETPFIRPREISDDYTPLYRVIEHVLKWLEEQGESFQYICCIIATAPFIRIKDIKSGLDLIKGKKVSSVFSVTSYEFNIFRSLKINEKGCLEMFWPEYEMTRSNDLPESYHDAGQFYWLDVEKFCINPKIYSQDSLPVIIPKSLVQDIDNEEDWERAELMYRVAMEMNNQVRDV